MITLPRPTREVVPRPTREVVRRHMVAVATLAVAILGTALNDGGITIWYTVTLTFTVTVAALWTGTSHPDVTHRPHGKQGPPTGSIRRDPRAAQL
jgi:hypothetical protein